MKRKQRAKVSIYIKLVLSYLLFSVMVIILLMASLYVVSLLRTKGHLDSAYPYKIVNEKVCKEQIAGIEGLGGWVEQLDEEYRIIAVYGEKKTDSQAYSPDDLFWLLSGDKASPLEYIGFINKSEDVSGYYLVQYHRKDITMSVTILYSGNNTNSSWNTALLILFFLLSVGLCLLMAAYLSRPIRRPLRSLSDAFHRVKEGEEAVVLDFKAEAEFVEIRDTFNVMTQSLAAAKREKEEAETKKNKMLLELSHDIRTPISTINSFAVALEEDMVKEEDKPGYYKTIHMKAIKVSSLADDMFMMLKMKSDGYQLQKQRADICEFLRIQCVEYFQDAQERGLEMDINIPETEIYYEADYPLLARMIGNLLSNAVKYNQTGKQIAVTLEKDRERILIKVADDGVAIDEEVRGRLFDDFVRADMARKSDGGTGLGLSIAKTIVEKHGGKISYEYQRGENCFMVEMKVV